MAHIHPGPTKQSSPGPQYRQYPQGPHYYPQNGAGSQGTHSVRSTQPAGLAQPAEFVWSPGLADIAQRALSILPAQRAEPAAYVAEHVTEHVALAPGAGHLQRYETASAPAGVQAAEGASKRRKRQRNWRRRQAPSAFVFPQLHNAVAAAVADELPGPRPWFNEAGGDQQPIAIYSTNVDARFACRNDRCHVLDWNSDIVTTIIRSFPGNGYDAIVYNQRCRNCKRLGTLILDEYVYTERIACRLKKWAGMAMAIDVPPRLTTMEVTHFRALCEGCRLGQCHCFNARNASNFVL